MSILACFRPSKNLFKLTAVATLTACSGAGIPDGDGGTTGAGDSTSWTSTGGSDATGATGNDSGTTGNGATGSGAVAGIPGATGGAVGSGATGGESSGAGGDGSGGLGSGGLESGGTTSGGGTSGGGTSGGGTSGGGTTSGGGGSGGSSSCTNVRPTGTQWDEATCAQWASETSECGNSWMINNHYCDESCGRCSASGGGGTSGGGGGTSGGGGGTSGGGGSGGGTSCATADLQLCSNGTGTHCGYTYEYWKDSGNGCMTNKANGFSVNWNGINNLLGRKGIRPGSANHVVTYSSNYQPAGDVSYLCVYGWSQSPLAEYYIVESWYNWSPPGNDESVEALGTVTSDGGTYNIFRSQRVNQPSIEGNKTFYQYWSVRQSKRTSGTVTVKNHFNAWASKGMNMGSIYEVSMTVEGYQSNGQADVTMSIATVP